MRVYHSNMARVDRPCDLDNERVREDPAFGVRSAQLDFSFSFDVHSIVEPPKVTWIVVNQAGFGTFFLSRVICAITLEGI